MPHVTITNQLPIAQNEAFQGIWQLTRGLLGAGWIYKASADATGAAKETTGNASFDRWAVGGSINTVTVAGQTGTAPQISAAVAGVSTITLLTGMSTTYSPGRHLQLAGCANAGNNGTFRIIACSGATSVTIWNPGAVLETGLSTTTWTEKGGGIAASIFAVGTAGAIVGRAIVTGLTGMVAPTTTPLNRGSVGDQLTLIGATTGANNGTFRITRYISPTSVEIDNSSATTDVSNGAIRWIEVSPTTQAYPSHLQGNAGSGAWINLQGPSTMKIPVGTNVVTGTFLKGEVINETTSGAQGVILGLCLDTVGGRGYIVVEPRLNGSGGGVRGWSIAADTITGATSGATIAVPNPTVPIEYVFEMVIWHYNAIYGHMYMQCVDTVGESAARFSTLATTTATIALCPGGPTGTFPLLGSWVFLGTGGSNNVTVGLNNWYMTGSTVMGRHHVMCANNIEGSGVSMDGSWIIAVGQPNTNTGAYAGTMFMRCDNAEEGDVCPYVTWAPSNGGQYPMNGSTRTTNTTTNNTYDSFMFGGGLIGFNAFSPYKSWRRRGFPTADSYMEFTAHSYSSGTNGGTTLISTNPSSPGHPATVATGIKFIKDPIWLITTQYLLKMRKGTMRWVFLTEGGVSNSTYESGSWVQLATSQAGPCVVGPWDGQSVPVNG